MTDKLIIDGSYGEGGGQILRSSLSLAAITGRPVCIENLRANRRKPGLAAQHLTSVRAAAMLCDADMHGAELGSRILQFIPRKPVRAGDYFLDVAEAREGGSAGSAMLVLQTLLTPLALAAGVSTVTLRGGTHVDMSPSFDYVHDVWLPTLARMGVKAELSLVRSGWYPIGQGEVKLRITGTEKLLPLHLQHRGPLLAVTGRALVAKLPPHIGERMAFRACDVLEQAGIASDVKAVVLKAACPGAGLYLTSHYQNNLAGFGGQGKRGKPAEQVAEEACAALLHHYRSGSALEQHLADQLILPAALCRDESAFSVERVTSHLVANAWVIRRFGLARIDINQVSDGIGLVKILPIY